MPSTIRLHRVFKAPPERVYRAFLDPDALVRWIPPYGYLAKIHEFNPTVRGGYRMSFTNFGTGHSHAFRGTYLELVPNQKLRYTDTFDDPNLPGEMTVTITLRAVSAGADLTIEQAGIPDAIPPDMCYLGWQESLAQLQHLVEPSIPDAP